MSGLYSSSLISTVERLQSGTASRSGRARRRWLEVLELSKRTYQEFLTGRRGLSEASIESLARHLELDPSDILSGNVNFQAVSARLGDGEKTLPEAYSVAAFGRRRTTITSFDFIEKKLGWRTRAEILRRFKINETVLTDFMAPINMQFMTDVADYLKKRHGVGERTFFEMGAHSAVGNRHTLIAEVLSAARSPAEAYEILFGGLIKFFEQNTRYSIASLDADGCTIDVVSYKYVAEALGVRHLGSREICSLKGGFLASIPLYIGRPLADVTETKCVHRGDELCRYEVLFVSAPLGRASQAAS